MYPPRAMVVLTCSAGPQPHPYSSEPVLHRPMVLLYMNTFWIPPLISDPIAIPIPRPKVLCCTVTFSVRYTPDDQAASVQLLGDDVPQTPAFIAI